MKTLGFFFVALATLGSAACTKVDTFNCLQSAECLDGIVQGECEPGTLLCSFPDPACPSGKSYGEYAGDQANVCVGGGPGTTTDPSSSLSDSITATGTGTSNGSATTVDPTSGTTTAVDPTTTTMTSQTDPTLTTDPSTSTGVTCAALGEPCDNNCCGGPCTVCNGTCQAQPPEMGPQLCGAQCQTCSPQGECAVASAGQACAVNCDDIVLDSQTDGITTTCRGYPSQELNATCNDGGECSPNPMECIGDAPSVIAQCDTVCVKDASLCVSGAIGVTQSDFCYLSGNSPDCKPTCSMDGLSSDKASCGATGTCAHEIVACGNYKCDPTSGICRTKCMKDTDCASNKCQGTKCQP